MLSLAALVGMVVLALSLTVPALAREDKPLTITGRTKQGSTATVVAIVSNPKNVTLEWGYFKQACADTELKAQARHAKDPADGGLSSTDGNLKRGRQTFKAKWYRPDAKWYVCAYLINDDTAATIDHASFHWK